MSNVLRVALVLLIVLLPGVALADDWTAGQLRGGVLQLVHGKWEKLNRGDVVPDSRIVRTIASGHVRFTRGAESIDLGPDTQIQIFDRGGARPFTTISEAFGTVEIEARVENVQHFAVDTPYLAAVVKGTHFTVRSTDKMSSVAVRRGHVAVSDKLDSTMVMVSAGQAASVDSTVNGGRLLVTGRGELPVVLAGGVSVPAAPPAGGLLGVAAGSPSGAGGNLVNLSLGGAGAGNSVLGVNIGGAGSSGNSLVGVTVGGSSGTASSLVGVSVGSASAPTSPVGVGVASGGSVVGVTVGSSAAPSGGNGSSGGLVDLRVGGLHLGL